MASASRSRNTILLVQYNLTIGSRTFMEFETLAAAMDEICALFERELKALNPSQSNMTYDIADLYAYIDQLCDISCLVYVCSTKLSVVLLPLILTLTLCAGTISQYRRTFRGTRTGLRSSCTCIYGRQPQKASWAPHGPPERACAGMPFALACGLERPVGRREVARFRSEGEVSVFSFHVLAFNERRFNKAADTATPRTWKWRVYFIVWVKNVPTIKYCGCQILLQIPDPCGRHVGCVSNRLSMRQRES